MCAPLPFVCVDTPQKVRPVAPAAAAVTAAVATGSVVNGNDASVIDLTESDDETEMVAKTIASVTAARACTNGFVSQSPQPAHIHSTVSHGAVSRCSAMSQSPQPAHGTVSHGTLSRRSTVSSPSPPVAIFDCSPVRSIPVSSPPVIHHNLPPSPLMVPTPPLLPPPLGPSSFHPAFPTQTDKMSSIPFLGSSSSSSSSSSMYSTLPSSSAAAAASSSLHYPANSLFNRSPYDSDAMLDFLTLMSGFSDFGGFSLPPNTFDYLYQSTGSSTSSRGAAAVDFGLDSILRGSPSPTL